MEYVVKGRKPASVFRFFEEISAIPRASYHEERLADYLVAFARERKLFSYRDKLNNVFIKAPATEGYKDRAPILFQGHTDMVCEKNRDVEHDFLKDGIKLWIDGGLLRAKGTTLGADNGIGVAIMLALLDGAIAEHPPIECLFTTAEEVGLDGAGGFDYSLVSAKRMVNLDSEKLGTVTCGCAGGVRSDLTLTCASEPFSGEAVCLSIGGLMGGHSGENINSGRANANKLMGRLLATLRQRADVRVVSIDGGSKDNAIPRECTALISVPDVAWARSLLRTSAEKIAAELVREDALFSMTAEIADAPATMLSAVDTLRAVTILETAANGVLEMSRDVEGLVEYSRNLGVVRTEGGRMTFVFSTRSSMESRLDAAQLEIETLAAATGCDVVHRGRYPGWNFAPMSPLRDAYMASYREVTGQDARAYAIHAGLECGIIRSHCPEMDMISIGPTMFDIHSPAEALDLGATEVLWNTLAALMEKL